jgi:hypothetical protein
MKTQRPEPKYKYRPTLYGGLSARMWSGAVVVTGVILVALYCLLTHRIPV